MIRYFAGLLLLLTSVGPALAQPSGPIPLYRDTPPRSVQPEELPPLPAAPPSSPKAATPAPEAAPAAQRVFCDQPVGVHTADPASVPERYRGFVGIFSDASWTPQLCAALIVEGVKPDGTANIVYVFGPMGSNSKTAGGVLRGTGIIRDGELRFENSDGSQFAFRPLYADLTGHLTTPQGQSYQALFKSTP